MTWLLDLDAETSGHLAVALRRHRQWAAHQGVRLPAALAEMQAKAEFRAREGQSGSPLADLWELSQDRVMPPQLLSLEAAAAVLSVSLSTVKRLVAAKSLAVVHVGSTPRIKVADLDAYVAGLGDDKESA